jgi:glycosyltransferase involved in cell wall biosynthesis
VRDRPLTAWSLPGALILAAKAVHGASACAGRLMPHRRFPHQLTMLERCLREAAGLRIAAQAASTPCAAVVTTASEALHDTAAFIAAVPHIRIVHSVVTTEDRMVRSIGRLARGRSPAVMALCPTDAVRESLLERFPDLPAFQHTYSVFNPAGYISTHERNQARGRFGLAGQDFAVCLIGGWWPHKDIETVAEAIARVTRPIHVIIGGSPVDDGLLGTIQDAPHATVHTLDHDLTQTEVRTIYAATNAAIVSRRAGSATESGLVMDAAGLGVPLILSDHDRSLNDALKDIEAVRLFRCGDAADLAAALDHVNLNQLARPDATLARSLGMATPGEMIDLLIATDTTVKGKDSD